MTNHKIPQFTKMVFIALTALVSLLSGASLSHAEMCASVSQHGITWKFDKAYETGKFANGDYWVLGPATITSIKPAFDGKHNGWEVNPVYSGPQGFDQGAGDFSAGLVPSLPYRAKPGESIVKAVSINQDPNSAKDCYPACLETAAVLTVLKEAPPGKGASVFRPPYVGRNKPYYPISSIHAERLPSIKFGAPVTLDSVKIMHERVQIDHKPGRMGRIIRPRKNLPDYGSAIAVNLNTAIARLMLDDPVEAKMEALIAVLQGGIDRHHAIQSGQRWPAGGGHEPGRKLSVAFTAYILDNEEMKSTVSASTALKYFSEDMVIQRGKNGKALFGLTAYNSELKYWGYLAKDPGYSLEFNDVYGYIDGGSNYARDINAYQFCCLSQPWKGAGLALKTMPGMNRIWNNPLFLDYVERWVSQGTQFSPDPCAGMHPDDRGKTSDQWKYYGVSYGPDGSGGCIKGKGRFPQNHGKCADAGYHRSPLVDSLWKQRVWDARE
jgi:hypothetical protein